MSLSNLEENLEKLQATLEFYAELVNVKVASQLEVDNIELKREYVKKEILRLTLDNKKLFKRLEDRYFPGGRRG